MDFDNRKVYGDTSITDGLVLIDLLQRPEAIATTPKKVTRVRSRDDSHKRAGVQF